MTGPKPVEDRKVSPVAWTGVALCVLGVICEFIAVWTVGTNSGRWAWTGLLILGLAAVAFVAAGFLWQPGEAYCPRCGCWHRVKGLR